MFKMIYELSMLAAEAQQAIWLRTIKLSAGGSAAGREAELMVTEKLAAAQQAFSSLAAAASAIGIVRAYRSKVRLNVRRLSRR